MYRVAVLCELSQVLRSGLLLPGHALGSPLRVFLPPRLPRTPQAPGEDLLEVGPSSRDVVQSRESGERSLSRSERQKQAQLVQEGLLCSVGVIGDHAAHEL